MSKSKDEIVKRRPIQEILNDDIDFNQQITDLLDRITRKPGKKPIQTTYNYFVLIDLTPTLNGSVRNIYESSPPEISLPNRFLNRNFTDQPKSE